MLKQSQLNLLDNEEFPELMEFAVGFPVPLSRTVANKGLFKMNGIFFPNFSDSFAKFDQDGQLLKTSPHYFQLSLDDSSEIYSGNFPTSGLLCDGICYHAPRLVEATGESAFSLLLPTPKYSDGNCAGVTTTKKGQQTHLSAFLRQFIYLNSNQKLLLNPNFVEAMMGFGEDYTNPDITEIGEPSLLQAQEIPLAINKAFCPDEKYLRPRIAALGNAIIPQVGQNVFLALAEILDLKPMNTKPDLSTIVDKISKPIARWYGGKWVLSSHVIKHFPEYKTYVEPYGGLFSVGLKKSPSEIEVYNDLNPEPVNFLLRLQKEPQQIIDKINSLKFDRELFDWSKDRSNELGLEDAVKFYVYCCLSFNGGGTTSGGTSDSRIERYNTQDHEHLWQISRRIENLQIYNQDAISIIDKFDSPDTLFYCDPCYVEQTRNSYHSYICEMDIKDHIQLAAKTLELQGYIVISGYDSKLYKQYFDHLNKTLLTDLRTTSGAKKQEYIWFNGETIVDKNVEIVDRSLTQLEKQIKTHLGDVNLRDQPAFVPIGEALTEIRDRKLYREKGYKNFGDYCKEIWQMHRSRAYQLINANQTYNLLKNENLEVNNLNELQCRVLNKAKSDEQKIIAYKNATEKAKEKGVSIRSENLKYEICKLQNTVSRPPIPALYSVVKLTSKFNIDLKQYQGYWGIVTEINEYSCNVRVVGAQLTNISTEDFMVMNLSSESDNSQALNLLERLDKISASNEIDRTVRNLIKEIATNPTPKLGEWQGYFIDTVERLLFED